MCFYQSSQIHKYLKRKKIWSFLLWGFSSLLHNYILHTVCTTVMWLHDGVCIPYVRPWGIVLSACRQCIYVGILHHRNSLCYVPIVSIVPDCMLLKFIYLQLLKEQQEVQHKNYLWKNMQSLSSLISEHIKESAVTHWSLEGDGKLRRKPADWSRHMEDMKMSGSGRRRERTLKTRGHVGGFTHCQ